MQSHSRSFSDDLLEVLPIGYFSVGEGRIMQRVNPWWCSMFGYQPDEVIGRPLRDFVAPDHVDRLEDLFVRMRCEGAVVGEDLDILRQDGERVAVLVDGRMADRRGSTTSHWFLRNATLEHEELEALRDSRERLKALSDATFEAVFLSENGICIDQNWAAERMFGATLEEAVGRSATEWIAPEDRDMVMARMIEGSEEPYEATALRRDGTTFPCEIQGKMIDYQSRRVRVTAVRNTTTRKRAEQALIDSETRNAALINAIPDPLFLLDERGVHLDYSAPGRRPLLRSPDEFLGKSLFEVHPPELAAKVQDAIDRALASDEVVEIETEIIRDGRTLWFEGRAVASGDHRVLVVVRDITEAKRLQGIEARAERLETAGRIASQVAHDFNNLLTPLMGYPELIRKDLPPGRSAIRMLDRIESAARQISAINQQLLTLGRHGHYNLEPLDLNAVVRESLENLLPVDEGYRVVSELAKDMRPMLGGVAQLLRAVSNLLLNGLEAMPSGGQLTVTTAHESRDESSSDFGHIPRGEYVRLTVADSGCGIPTDAVDRIFDPFFSTKTDGRQRGSGLGLSIVDSVVREHGGFIDLETASNAGTAFHLYFPVTDLRIPPRPDGAPEGRGESVLVVDDDEVHQEVMIELLERLGYRSRGVSSGEEAVETC